MILFTGKDAQCAGQRLLLLTTMVLSLSACGGGGGGGGGAPAATQNSTETPVVTPAPEPPIYTEQKAATVLLPLGISGDGENMDINPELRREDNDSAYGAFAIPQENGRISSVVGAVTRFEDDQNDFFQVALTAGTVISMVCSEDTDPTADADLYLYNEQLQLVNASLNATPDESLSISEDGNYYIEVSHRLGDRIKYSLNFSDAGVSSSQHDRSLSSDFIEDEFILSAQGPGQLPTIGLLGKIIAGTLGGSSLLKAKPISSVLFGLLAPFNNSKQYQRRRDSIGNQKLRKNYDSLVFARALENLIGGSVEPNLRLGVSGISSNDSAAAAQWGAEQIGVENAWQTTDGSADVRVAVIDTGFMLQHRDLQHSFIEGWNYIDDNNDANASSQLTLQHGTHVAGIIAAQRDNQYDIAGIAPATKIMPIKVIRPDCLCGSLYDAMQGILWAAGLDNSAGTKAALPAQIINLSIDLPNSNSISLANTINAARDAGSVVVWAAGNNSSRIDVADNHSLKTPGLLVVSASGLYGKLSSFSNYGNVIDLIAPGGDSDYNNGGQGIRSLTGFQTSSGSISYGSNYMQGTSQAAPHVSGVLALMASVWDNFNPDSVELMLGNQMLTQDSGVAGPDVFHGNGRIDAEKAVAAASNNVNQDQNFVRLNADPGELQFGGSFDNLTLSLEANQNNIEALHIAYQPSWLTLTATDVGTSGLGDWNASIDRSGFGDELYEDVIIIESGDSKLYVPVIAHGENYLPRGTGINKMLIEFLHPSTKQRLYYVEADIDSSNAFSFDSSTVPSGNYIVRASSDLDNNGQYCETGELCGYLYNDINQSTYINGSNSLNGREIQLALMH